ncbi:hypothetical protein HXY32_04865 [Candidatus Bathyarchaeota archaeon]|nr:hypothetical protein [Candidatus Bathyarchaeota archaeon]
MKKAETGMQRIEHASLKRHEAIILLLSIFMISFAVLTFEISLTRMFAVMFAYHYAFLAIATTFAGLGIGGILAYLIFPKTPKKELFASLTIVYSLFSLLTSLFTIATVSSPSPNFFAVTFLFFLSFIPSGVFLATVYRFFASYNNVIYGSDIVGTSLGSIAVITFLNGFNPITTVLLVSSVLSIASIFIALVSSKKKVLSAAILVLLIILSAHLWTIYSAKDVPLGSNQGKELVEYLNNPAMDARIVESRWNAFGRTDLVEFENALDSKVIFIDGGAGTEMYRFDGNFTNSNSAVYSLRFSTAAYPFYFMNNENALIIGPGGGKDVLITLMFNVSHIHAVEINQNTVNIVRDYSDYNGGIYTNYANVHVHVDEGRSFLKRNATKYDTIMLNIPVTKTIQGSTGYSLAENYLFTTDSFKDYWNHLTDNGQLIIVAHERLEIYKLVATALEALKSEGKSIQESMRQIVVAESMHHSMFPVLILKRTAFTFIETSQMLEKSLQLSLIPVYFPNTDTVLKQELDQTLVELADGKKDLNALIAAASLNSVDIEPPTDDRPFFYKFEVGLPFMLILSLAGAAFLAVFVTIVYLLFWGRRISLASKKVKHLLAEKFSAFMPFYFASLGLGFMLVEIALVQKFILFLGPPTLAISIVLFSLLLSMGIGGFFSKKWKEPTNLALKVSLLIGVIIISYIFTLPAIFDAFLGYDINMRLTVSFVLAFPVGFLLGIPFPSGVKIMNQQFDSGDISWMWGINGLYSLLGSTLAVVIALSFGFSIVLLLGGVTYLLIFLIGRSYFKK